MRKPKDKPLVEQSVTVYLLYDGDALRTAVIFFYVSNEGISILENAVSLGLPVPTKLKDSLAQLHKRKSGDAEKDSEKSDKEEKKMALTQIRRDFISKVGASASEDMPNSQIPTSLKVAQSILESGFGTSALATQANALFGIKADSRWNGRVYSTKTKECYDGINFTTVDALFRAYDSWEHSISDHSAFLIAGARYAAVIGEKRNRYGYRR